LSSTINFEESEFIVRSSIMEDVAHFPLVVFVGNKLMSTINSDNSIETISSQIEEIIG
jgi:hypothetical protein